MEQFVESAFDLVGGELGERARHLLFGDGRHPVRFRQWDVIVAQLLHEAVRIPVAMIEIVFDQRGDASRRLTPGAKGLVACQGQLGVDGEDDMSSYSFDHVLFQVVAAVGHGEQRLANRAFAGVVLPGDDRDPVQRDGGRRHFADTFDGHSHDSIQPHRVNISSLSVAGMTNAPMRRARAGPAWGRQASSSSETEGAKSLFEVAPPSGNRYLAITTATPTTSTASPPMNATPTGVS